MLITEIRKSACVIPILNVNNIQASFDFYVQKLQFEKRWDWGEPATFACVALGDAEIFLCQGGQGHAGTWLSLFISDVDAYYADIKQRGATIVHGPVDESWGIREVHVRDPDGHILRFGTSCGDND